LPSGDPFDLDDTKPGAYLHHVSGRGEFFLTSDSMQTWLRWQRMRRLTSEISESEREHFLTVAHQIGGRILFPGRRIDKKPTINQARGVHGGPLADRWDLTLECIRLHYPGEISPLAETLARYADFFDLFDDFKGYIDFFLLGIWCPGIGRR
jgi:hypothetical protein